MPFGILRFLIDFLCLRSHNGFITSMLRVHTGHVRGVLAKHGGNGRTHLLRRVGGARPFGPRISQFWLQSIVVPTPGGSALRASGSPFWLQSILVPTPVGSALRASISPFWLQSIGPFLALPQSRDCTTSPKHMIGLQK